MATALAAQLAQIAANSKSSLNVKAQKAAHSKSLIFEPRVAAGQSLQTIYTTCFEGFEELCHLDSRFSLFSTTLFSEQSQDEDRTQMTAEENVELDRRIESFLRLVGGCLRLMPAVKCVEWLIRRFRIHEFNTLALLTTFLPYHSLPVFLTLMSILPPRIPHEYSFLDPYIRSLTAPSRAVIVREATSHSELLSSLSAHVLESCRTQQHYPALISFWGGVMTEAVNGMLDKMRSGRKSIQVDNDQALLQQLGPILSEALVMKNVPDLQVASYMVVSILASKGGLDDAALSAFMEQLVHGWNSKTLRPGLVCLAVLANYRSAKQLPGKVARAVVKLENLAPVLVEISQKHPVEKLANGLTLALADRIAKKGDVRGLPLIKHILLSGVLGGRQISVVFKALLVAAHMVNDEVDQDGDIRKDLGMTLVTLAQASGETGDIIRKTIEEVDFDIEEVELRLDTSIRLKAISDEAEDEITMGEDQKAPPTSESLEAAVERLSMQEYSTSFFLSQQPGSLFDELCQLFVSMAVDQPLLAKLEDAPFLRRTSAANDCLYFTFYMRVWCGPYPTLARVAALDMAKTRLKSNDCAATDFQAIIPYCIAALSDPARRVRRATVDLLTVLGSLLDGEHTKQSIWGSKAIYDRSNDIRWMDEAGTRSLLHAILLPALEESVLHEEHVSAVLSNALDSSSKSPSHPVSHSARLSILTSLASHVNCTPLILVKLRLLKALNQVRGVSGTSRTQLMLPCLQSWAVLSASEASQCAAEEKIDEDAMNIASVQIVLPNDKAGLDLLFDIIKNATTIDRPDLIRHVFLRVRKMWTSMKAEAKFSTAQTMLGLTQDTSDGRGNKVVSLEAADFLRNVPLTTDILQDFLDNLQDSAKMATDPPPYKRRRVSMSDHSRAVNTGPNSELGATLGKITFVLQLIEGSKPAEHPQLLQSLFMTLSDLQHLRTVVGSELGYLQNLVLSSLLAMMPAYKNNRELSIDASVGHGDVLVTCIQRSSSPAVQNAALLLVASLAKTAPEVVLHSVMPIFTFMGNSVLRQGDDYSAHVINQTIKEVVPPLIETFRKSRRNLVASASELLSSFVIAYEHIPSHRKHDLFFSLIENLGPEDFLFALLAMFVDKYGTTENMVTFLARIMDSFSVEVQLQTLVKFLDLISDIFKPKPSLSAALLGKNEDGEQDLQKAALKEFALLSELLSSRRLKAEIGHLAERDDMDAAKMRDLYATLLEGILSLMETTKSRKPVHNRCGEGLSRLLNLLSISEFIRAVETLLDRPNSGLRQKVLRALEVRIDSESNTDPKSRTALLSFLPYLTAIIRESNDISYKHTAVSSVDKIAEKYGKKDTETVIAAASTIAGEHCLGQQDRRLRIMALLCLASLVDVLHEGIVPILPVAVPQALKYLRESLAAEEPDRELHNAVYTFVMALAQHITYMMSESYVNELMACSNISAEAGLDGESNEHRKNCLRFLAKLVEARTLFSVLQHNWPLAAAAGFSALAEYLEVLGMAIDKHPKSAISKNVSPLSAIFLSAFDLRLLLRSRDADAGGAAAARIGEIEITINEVTLKMIYKLNDGTFRPIFSQLMEWSASGPSKQDSPGRVLRQQAVYGFLATFFENLKSIVTSYATYVVDGAATVLKTVDPKNADGRELWRRVLRTLTACFRHDQDDFWQAPSHFGAIAPVLTAQLLHAASSASAADVVADELVPAIVELAAAADSAEHQRELNGAVLRHLRSEAAATRLAAVRCESALVERLGEDWLGMLPEMLPYISELQDDDDEAVERETQRWIMGIEAVLGESLEGMLQ